MGTIRKRGRKWTIDYTDGAGARRRQDLDTKEEAARELARRTIESGQALPRSLMKPNITVREYFGESAVEATAVAEARPATGWINVIVRQVKPKSWRVYETLGRKHVVPALGHLHLRQLHRAHIRAFVAALLDEPKLSRGTVRLIVATLRVMLSAAVEDGLLLVNPAFGIGRKMKLGKANDEEDIEVKPFTVDQLARFLETARATDKRFYALFATMALAGLRIGEALALKWTDIDLDGRELRVSRTLAAAGDAHGSPKSGKGRSVDLNETLATVLGEAAAAQRVDAMRRGVGGAMSTFVFPSTSGQPLDDDRARKVFARVLATAGLPRHHTPHHLRHSFCALLLAEGVPITYVMAQAGHSSIDVLVRNYGRWIPKSDRSLINRFNAKLAPARAALLAVAGMGVSEPEPGRLHSSQAGVELASFAEEIGGLPVNCGLTPGGMMVFCRQSTGLRLFGETSRKEYRASVAFQGFLASHWCLLGGRRRFRHPGSCASS